MGDDEIDDDFLAQVAYLESQALKRRKIAHPEGPYTAALKGSRSQTFITKISPAIGVGNNSGGGGGIGGGGGEVAEKKCKCGAGVCVVLTANTEKNRGRKFYKCPLREDNGGCGFFEWCDKNTEADLTTVKFQSYASNTSAFDLPNLYGAGGGGEVAEKGCPCGVGVCAVLTANTEKNRGRKFYKCPVREDNGGCGFFEWCDKNTEADPTTVKFQNYASNTSAFDLPIPYGAGGGGEVVEKRCPCGVGACAVLTANTEKNRGRKFYKCPVREDNGGCGFFEWCDKITEVDSTIVKSQSYASNTSASDLSCPCGAGSCLMLTAKTGKNIGQQFYRCPANQSCGYFKWCHDLKIGGDTLSYSANATTTYMPTPSSQNSLAKNGGSSCFKCGKDGHWARDCSVSANASITYNTTKTNQSNFCQQ